MKPRQTTAAPTRLLPPTSAVPLRRNAAAALSWTIFCQREKGLLEARQSQAGWKRASTDSNSPSHLCA